MKIKELAADDTPAVLALVENIVAEQGLQAEFYWPQEMLMAELASTESLAVYENEQLAGFVLYRLVPSAWEISVVATDPKFRRRGLMEQLLRELINARGHDGELWLEVHEKNVGAQKLYEKLGFRRTGQRPKYYKDQATAHLYSYP
jgi:ribosomal-protein-alanine N-acetyltransferase